VQVCRWRDVTNIPIVKAATATSSAEQMAVIITNLQQRGTAKPRPVKTLSTTINSLFQKQLSEEDVALLIDALEQQGIVSINNTKVSYTLPV